MNIRILRGFLPCALLLVSLPVFGQSARLIWQGPAYAYAEDNQITEGVIDQVLGVPVGNGAQVVFFRPVDTDQRNTNLSEGDTLLAQLPGGSYYATAVDPGNHTFVVDGNSLQLQLAPGERHYVKVRNRNANPQLFPSNGLTFLRIAFGKRPPLY